MRTLFLFICCICFFSCRKNTTVSDPPHNSGNTDTVQLKPGTPVDKGDLIAGSQASATIGASGGTLTSDDGKFVLTVPGGALDGQVQFTVSRRKATVFQSVGSAGYEVSRLPERPFKSDVYLTCHYTPENLDGTAPEGVRLAAYENAAAGQQQGTFHRVPSTQRTVDKANRTVRFRVKPERWKNLFAYYADYKLLTVYADGKHEEQPAKLVLSLHEKLEFRLVRMGYQTEPGDDLFMPLSKEKVLIPITKEQIIRWTMNDLPETQNAGNLYGSLKLGVTPNARIYQAPPKLPNDTGFLLTLKADLRVPHPTNPAITSEVQLLQQLKVVNLTRLEFEGSIENMEPYANKVGATLQTVLTKNITGANPSKAGITVLLPTYNAGTSIYDFREVFVGCSNSITGSGKEFTNSYKDDQGNTVYTSGTVNVTRNDNNRVNVTIRGSLARKTNNGVEVQPVRAASFFGAEPF